MKPKKTAEDFRQFSLTRAEMMANGFRLYLKENKLAPVVSVQLWLKTGSVNEGDYLGCGLSHFLEHMVFQGSNKYPGLTATERVYQCGGDINAYTSYGCTVFYIDMPADKIEEAIDILFDLVANPLFPKKRFFDEKKVILRERDMILDHPGRVLSEKLWQTVFMSHPVRHPIIGYKDQIERVDRDMMLDYYNRRFSPSRSFMVISGDFDYQGCLDKVAGCLQTWGRGQLYEPSIPEEPKQFCQRSTTFRFKDPLSRISIGYQAPSASEADIPALDILAGILENGNSSRLTKKLRNEKHLANNIDTFNFNTNFCGMFGINALCNAEKSEALIEAVFDEIDDVVEHGVKQNEIDRVVTQQKTDYFRSLKSNRTIAGIVGNTVLSYNSADYADNYIQAISRVTSDDIVRVGKAYLNPDSASVVRQLPENSAVQAGQAVKGKRVKKLVAGKPSMVRHDNGAKSIVVPNHHLPLVDICLILPGGTITETSANSGVSHLLAGMLQTGAKGYSENKLADILDSNAIDLNIHSGNNTLSFRFNCHKEKLDIALKLLRAIVCEPAFSQPKFEREKRNKLETLQSRQLSPQNAAEDKLCRLMYGQHPYSMPSVGLEESVECLTTDDIKCHYHMTCLNGQKAVIGVSGDIDAERMSDVLQDIIEAVPWAEKPQMPQPRRPIFPDGALSEKVYVPREQSVVMLGQPGCDMKNSDHYALDVLQVSLNSLSSRIYKKIREDLGLAYYTGMFSSRGQHPGFIGFYAGTQPESAEQVTELLDIERKKLAANGITQDEFESGCACIYNELNEQDLNYKLLLFNSVLSEFYGVGFQRPWKLRNIFKKLTLSQVNTVVSSYLSDPCLVKIIAGPEVKRNNSKVL